MQLQHQNEEFFQTLSLSARVPFSTSWDGRQLALALATGPSFELARTLAQKSPHAMRASKSLIDRSWRADARLGLALEESLQLTLLGSPNQVEAVNASLGKRAPRFSDV